VLRRSRRLRGRLRRAGIGLGELGLGRLDAVDHRVQVLVRHAEALEDPDQRVAALGRERFRPASCELNARDRVIAATDADLLAATLAIVAPIGAFLAAVLSHVHRPQLYWIRSLIERRELQCAGPQSNTPRSVECLIAFSWNSELPSGHNPFW